MVILRVAPDDVECLPFAVGEIHERIDNTFRVQWYGPKNGNVLGIWKPGFFQPNDNRRYYHRCKLSKHHELYTSVTTETRLTLDDVIAYPFTLAKKKIPKTILKIISDDNDIDWELPGELLAHLFQVLVDPTRL